MTPRGLWTHCRSPLCGKALRRDNTTGFCAHCQQGEVPGGRRWFKRTRPGAAEYRAQDVARRKERELARWARGLCVWCEAPSTEHVRCAACRARKNEGCRRWRASHVRAGLCCKCMRSAVPGKTKCAAHLAADAAGMRRLYAAYRERRRCA